MGPKLKAILKAIKDKNLYRGEFFFISFFYVMFGLFFQCLVYTKINSPLIIVYIPLYISLIIFSALPTKNIPREFHPMGKFSTYMVFIAGILSESFAFIFHFENSLAGFLQLLLVLNISMYVFIVSLITIIVLGQRNSLRSSLGLKDNFFEKEKEKWKNELKDFQNLDKVLESLGSGRFVAKLFDKGLFNLTVLWSCNVMEEAVNAITDEIILKNPETKKLFRKEICGRFQPYPIQLKNLGFEISRKIEDAHEQINIETLWKIRNNIAHCNHIPNYYETSGAIKILISVIKEMPEKLKNLDMFPK